MDLEGEVLRERHGQPIFASECFDATERARYSFGMV